jgi:hypothetical protein
MAFCKLYLHGLHFARDIGFAPPAPLEFRPALC